MLKKDKKTDDITEKKKEKKERKHGKLFVVLTVIFTVALVIAAAVFFVLYFCNIKTINMSGNTVLAQAEIEKDLLVDEYDKNAVILLIKNVFTPRKDIPFVESMEMSMSDLNTVNIKIKEKEMTGYLMDADKNRIYYNSDGVVQEISKVKVKGIPRIVYEGEQEAVSQGQQIPVREKSRRELLALQRDLKNNEINVTRIEITEEGNFTMYHKDIIIKLGTASNMTEKVMRLQYILPKVKKKVGILHLEDWSEGNTDIVFEMTGA